MTDKKIRSAITPLPIEMAPLEREQVLDATHVPSRGPLYAIAPYPKRINFASQQTRAFNLVWALTASERVQVGDRVAVIGAGLAGLTAAAALRRKNIDVKVFEANEEALKIQRYTTSRYVHPTLNYWPTVDLTPIADFPCLYWSAGRCSDVIDTIRTQWESEFGNDLIEFGSRVEGIEPEAQKLLLEIEGGRMEGPFDAVILAVGFGLEEPPAGAFLRSYWENLDPRAESSSKRIYVSGVGDGGLLEALRLTYDNFGEGQLTSKAARLARRLKIGPKLEEIEEEARKMAKAEDSSKHLAKKYQTLKLDPELEEFFANRLTGERKVTLLTKGAYAYSLASAPIHRLMLARAIHKKTVHVEPNVKFAAEGPLAVEVKAGPLSLNDALLIVRHGPAGEIGKLLSVQELDKLEALQRVLSRYQYHQLWPSQYFDTESPDPLSKQDQAITQMKLDTVLPSLVQEFNGVDFAIKEHGEELGFEARLKPTCSLVPDDFPQQILGRPLVVKQMQWLEFAGALAFKPGGPSGTGLRLLRPGDRISTSRARRTARTGVLGCFVRAAGTNAAYGVTAAHVLGASPGDSVYASGPDEESWQPIGSVAERCEGQSDDVGLIELSTNVGFEMSGEAFAGPVEAVGTIGRSVIRRLADGTIAHGRVTGVASKASIKGVDGEHVVEQAIIVRPDAGSKFAVAGDSGALVKLDNQQVLGVVVAGDGEEVLVAPVQPTLRRMAGELALEGREGQALIRGAPGEMANSREVDLDKAIALLEDTRTVSLLDWGLDLDEDLKLLHPSSHLDDLFTFSRASHVAHRPLFYVSEEELTPRFAIEAKRLLDTTGKTRVEIYRAKRLHVHLHGRVLKEVERATKGRPVPLHSAIVAFVISRSTQDPHVDSVAKMRALPSHYEFRWSHHEPVKLAPTLETGIEAAIYEIASLRDATRNRFASDTELHFEITRSLGRTWLSIMEEMLQGHLVTLRTARMVEVVLTALGRSTGGVRMAGGDDLLKRRAAYSERLLRRASKPAG